MKKGRSLFVLAILLIIVFSIILVGCTNNSVELTGFEIMGPTEFTVGDFDCSQYKLKLKYSDDSTGEVALASEMISNVDKNLLQKVGNHTITINYNDKSATIKFNVLAKDFSNVKFEDKTISYDGDYHGLVVENIPENTVVTFDTENEYKDVGEYEVTATITNPQYKTITKTATLTITKASYDMSEVVFEDSTVEYNGEEQYIYANNLPNGVTVEYVNNGQIEIGEYEVTAKFTGDDNYDVIPDMTAKLIITKQTYDMSNVEFNDGQFYCNGEEHYIYATNLPDGVTVEYTNNGQIEIGEYSVIAKFTGDDKHEPIADMTATLRIGVADITGVKLEDKIVEYDGTPHKLEITGELPEGIFVQYENNEQTELGTYDVIVKFVDKNGNGVGIDSKTAKLSIVKQELNITFDNKTFEYDGTSKEIQITGQVPVGIKVIYVNNGHIDAGSYIVIAKFVDINGKDIGYPNKEATLTISRRKSKVNFSGNTDLVYNGKIQKTVSATLTRVLPKDKVNVTLTYSGDMIEAGEYQVTATIDNTNYELENSTTTVNITRANHNVTFKQQGYEDIVFVVKDLESLDVSTLQNPKAIKGYDVEWNIEGVDFTCITKEIVININKTPIKYKITYDLKGGVNNPKNPTEYTIESGDLILYAPTYFNYEFNGWYEKGVLTTGNKITKIPAGSTGDITLYAEWAKYIVESVAEGFEIIQEELLIITSVPNKINELDLSNKITVSENCKWKLYMGDDFTGQNELGLKSVENLNVGINDYYIIVFSPQEEPFLRYKLQIYKLDIKTYTFMSNGEIYDTDTIEELKTIDAPKENPINNGYLFAGWSVNGELVEFPYIISKDVIFNANWNPINYDIKYNLNGGSLTGEILTYTIEDTVILVNPSREHYIFAGWFDNENMQGEAVPGFSAGNYGDKEYFAKWTPYQYCITLDSKGGVLDIDNNINYTIESETIDLPINVIKTGYVFKGWYESEESIEKIERISKGSTGNKTLIAKWQSNTYEITYDVNTGDALDVNKQEVIYDSDVTLITPTKTGYTFMGWQNEGTMVENGLWKIDHDVTLIAKWQANYYTVSAGEQCVNVQYDAAFSLSIPQERKGYTFDGWYDGINGKGTKYTDEKGKSIINWDKTKNTELYPKWLANAYEIQFNANHGSGNMLNQKFTYDIYQNISKNNFTRVGYTFVGWTLTSNGSGNVYYDEARVKNLSSVDNSIVILYAKWQANVYKITTTEEVQHISVKYDSSFKLRIPRPKEGYTFNGWYDGQGGTGTRYTDANGNSLKYWDKTNDATLYPKWIVNTYTVKYNANGGSGNMLNQEFTYDESQKLLCNEFTKEGYTFTGWTIDGAEDSKVYTNEETVINLTAVDNKIVNLYARWQANNYTITYDVNHGDALETATQIVTYDSNVTLAIPTKKGYTFTGWYNGESLIENGNWEIAQDVKLIAKWSANEYAIISQGLTNQSVVAFDLNGATGKVPTSQRITKNKALVYPEIPTREGYVFVGWYDNSNCIGMPFDFTTSIVEDKTLYAKWIKHEGKDSIKYNSNVRIYCFGKDESNKEYYAFVPLVSGEISIYSNSDWDTFGFLYNAQKELLKSNDDDGSGYNFKIQYNVKSGNLYYIRACGYRERGTAEIYLTGPKVKDGGKNNFEDPLIVKYDAPFKLNIPATREGYTFEGWYEGEGGTGKKYTDCNGNSLINWDKTTNATLYQKWVTNKYNITFESNGGSPVESITQEYGSNLELPTPVWAEKSFEGWYDSTYTIKYTSISKMPSNDLKLYAKWVNYDVQLTILNSTQVSVSDDISDPNVFGASAVDTDGNDVNVTIQLLSGNKVAGQSIMVRFIAQGKYGIKTAKTINDIKVYGMPKISYDTGKNYINITDTINGTLFNATAVDSYSEPVKVIVLVKDEIYAKGDIVTIVLKATDIAGNTSVVEVPNIKVYGEPNISKDDTITDISTSDLINNELFGVSATDNFGETIDVVTELYSGSFKPGEIITIRSKATDSKGNIKTIFYDINVYGTPNITNATTTEFKVSEEITLDSLGIVATDSFGEKIENINIELTNGIQEAGNTLTYMVTATDKLGNISTKTVGNIKIYGLPTISYNSEKSTIMDTDSITPELFEVTANDSFGETIVPNVSIETGIIQSGNIVTFNITAVDKLGNTTSTITKSIKVYSINGITLKYNKFASVIIKMGSKGEEFLATATDSFGENCTISVRAADGFNMQAGNTIDVIIVAQDVLGNTKESEVITGIKVYGKPTITYVRDNSLIYNTENPYSVFIAKDSFDGELVFDIKIVEGIFEIGKSITYEVSASDRAGNEIKQQYKLYVVETEGSIIKLIADDVEVGYKYVIRGQNYKLISYKGYEVVWSIDGVAITDNQANSLKSWDKESNIYIATTKKALIEYEIQYDLNGGNANNPRKFTIFTENIVVNNPTKIGYKFIGWTGTDLESLTENLIIDTTALENKKYVANWEVCVYTITYELNGGKNSIENLSKYTIEDNIVLKNPTRTGYEFVKWQIDGVDTNTIEVGSFGEKTATAVWNIINYTITYELNGGILAEKIGTYTIEDSINLSNYIPTKDYYDFVEWQKDGEKIEIITKSTGEITLSAIFNPIEYTITYNLNGGILAEKPITYTVEDIIDLSNYVPVKEGYAFVEWQKNSEKIDSITNSNGNITLIAIYKLINYTITYELNGGKNSIENPSKYTINDNIVLKNPTRLGYEFVKWQIDGVDTNTIEVGSFGEKTATAVWNIINYTITYELNGGILAEKPGTYTIEDSINLSNYIPTKDYYDFVEWQKDGEKIEIISNSTGDIVLSAWFSPTKYQITYEVSGGYTNNPEYYTVENEVILRNPGRQGYEFVKWQIDGVDTNLIEIGSFGDKTAVAVWKVINYTITYELNGGILNEKPSTYTIEDTIDLSKYIPVKEHYDFVEWQTRRMGIETITNRCEDITLTAIYKPTKYQITYELDGGHNYPHNPTTYTIEDSIFLSDPEKKDYKFITWQINGVDTNVIERGSFGEKIATAIWRLDCYKINYHIQGDENIKNSVYNDNIPEIVSSYLPYMLKDLRISDTRYMTNGWYLDSNYTKRIERLEELKEYDLYTKITDMEIEHQFKYKKYAVPTSLKFDLGITNYLGNEQYVTIPTQVVDNQNGETKVVGSIFASAFNNLDIKAVFMHKDLIWIEKGSFSGCNNVTLYCEAAELAKNHNQQWNLDYSNSRPVVFNYGGYYGETKDGFKWALLKDGTIAISEYVGTALDIVIPTSIEGRPVSTICENAFKNNNLNTIYVKKNIKNIYGWAFMNTKAKIYFEVEMAQPEWSQYWNSEVLQEKIFFGVAMVDSIIYQVENVNLQPQNSRAFLIDGKKATGDIVIPSKVNINNNYYTVLGIKPFAFADSKYLRSVKISEGIVGIEEAAFYGCSKLLNIEIPHSVEFIGKTAFAYCSELKNLTIPGMIREIPGYMLQGCTNLESINIGSNVLETIMDAAFINCINLGSIVIRETVFSLGTHIFENCNKLTIYFEVKTLNGKDPYIPGPSLNPDWNISLCPVVFNYEDKIDHTYNFVLNGEQNFDSITAKGIIKLPTPIKNGLYFDGWYTSDKYLGDAISTEYWNSQNTTLYGRWLNEEKLNDGSSIDRARHVTSNALESFETIEPNQSIFFKIRPTLRRTYQISNSNPCNIYIYDEYGTLFTSRENTTSIILDVIDGKWYYYEIRPLDQGIHETTIRLLQ